MNKTIEQLLDPTHSEPTFEPHSLTIKEPNLMAKITLCGCITLYLSDEVKGFIKPTPEQIKNLKEMLCIDVEML